MARWFSVEGGNQLISMYQVTRVDNVGSPWELLAKSPDHAIATIRKFYPRVCDVDLVAVELTLSGDPVTLIHQLSYGDTFTEILSTVSGKPAMSGRTYTRGDFNPVENAYLCYQANGRTKYFTPYTKIIKK